MVEIEIAHPKYNLKPILKRITCPACKRDVYLTAYARVLCPCGKYPYLNLVLLSQNLAEYKARRITFHKDGN